MRHKAKKHDLSLATEYAIAAGRPSGAPWQRCRIRVTLVVAANRNRDIDNAYASLKGFLDGLTPAKEVRGRWKPGAGIIVDDGTRCVERIDVEWRIDKANAPATEIIVERL